jgi:enoyl-CoA hydratase/carnithine racemase
MIEFEIDGHIAQIKLNRPEKLNAVTPEMLQQMSDIVEQIDLNQDIRVVLVVSTGEKAFCVGADIEAWAALSPLDMWRDWVQHGHRVFDRIAGLRQPVIAVLQGHTLGGGLELAMCADIRLAAENVKLGQPEVKIATLPGWGGTWRLPELVGVARAKQMIFSGESIGAQTALAWGLINEVHPESELSTRAMLLAHQIAANAPVAVQLAKQVIDAGMRTGVAPMILEALSGALSATTGDAKEGIAAFRERRAGDFQGE